MTLVNEADLCIHACAATFGVCVADMSRPCRWRTVIFARHTAWLLLRRKLHLSYPQLAKTLGKRDHTTVIHAVRSIEAKIRFDEWLADHVRSAEQLYERNSFAERVARESSRSLASCKPVSDMQREACG